MVIRMVIRKKETFEPVTLGHIRSHGCRNLLVYCDSGRCHHSATMNADHLPDDTIVRTLGPKMVCTKCGHVGPMCAPTGRRMLIKGTSSSPCRIGLVVTP